MNNRHRRHRPQGPRPWQPLQRAEHVAISEAQLQDKIRHSRDVFPEVDEATVRSVIAECAQDEVWRNDRYQVHIRRQNPSATCPDDWPVVHLSIRRIDRAPVRDWRDLQRIKNQLVGPECEAIELYPAESRVVDTSNQFHLFAIADPDFRFPFGWHAGRYVDGRSGGGAVQRPLDNEIA